jgi:hypothetical protein
MSLWETRIRSDQIRSDSAENDKRDTDREIEREKEGEIERE